MTQNADFVAFCDDYLKVQKEDNEAKESLAAEYRILASLRQEYDNVRTELEQLTSGIQRSLGQLKSVEQLKQRKAELIKDRNEVDLIVSNREVEFKNEVEAKDVQIQRTESVMNGLVFDAMEAERLDQEQQIFQKNDDMAKRKLEHDKLDIKLRTIRSDNQSQVLDMKVEFEKEINLKQIEFEVELKQLTKDLAEARQDLSKRTKSKLGANEMESEEAKAKLATEKLALEQLKSRLMDKNRGKVYEDVIKNISKKAKSDKKGVSFMDMAFKKRQLSNTKT